MFAIFFGRTTRVEEVGAVGEWCERCGEVRAFLVKRYYQHWHIYFLPLGRGKPVRTTRECWRCGAKYLCRLSDYTAFVPEEEAEGLPLAELLDRTNGRMPDALRPRRRR